VADRLGLAVYGERSNTNVIADASVDVTLAPLGVAYSNQEIPYFEVEDSFTTEPADLERIIVASASNEQLKTSDNIENSMLAFAPAVLESPVDVKSEVTRLNDELLDAQNVTAEAQTETSNLRAIIISLNNEISILQDKLQTIEVKEANAVSQGLGGSKTGYLGSDLSGRQLIALVTVILAGIAVLIYYTVRWVIGVKSESMSDVEVNPEPDVKVVRLNSELDFSDDEIFGEGGRQPADVFANVASRDDAIEESLINIDSLEFSDELHPEGASNLDYLDMTENIDPVDVKLDLAETYADLGDIAGAKEILEEIISESNKEGKRRATEVLERLDFNSSS
jgi:FimV-like protein